MKLLKLFTIFFITITFFSIDANAKDGLKPKKAKLKSKTFKAISNKDLIQKNKVIDLKCHICCWITTYNPLTGANPTVHACAGWLLTSCETAAERACARAEILAETAANTPGG